jgi:hypothetical protein
LAAGQGNAKGLRGISGEDAKTHENSFPSLSSPDPFFYRYPVFPSFSPGQAG